jgi:hypothetical protein
MSKTKEHNAVSHGPGFVSAQSVNPWLKTGLSLFLSCFV